VDVDANQAALDPTVHVQAGSLVVTPTLADAAEALTEALVEASPYVQPLD
jgi:hypothetical protein